MMWNVKCIWQSSRFVSLLGIKKESAVFVENYKERNQWRRTTGWEKIVILLSSSLRASSPFGDIVKSRRARGTLKETRKRGAGEANENLWEVVASSPFLGPSRLCRSFARSRAACFARPNRRACSQANYQYHHIIGIVLMLFYIFKYLVETFTVWNDRQNII